MENNPIICAIDSFDLGHSYKLASSMVGKIAAIKLGLEFFTYCGFNGVKKIAELGIPIFLDLKLHDIPNTIKKTAAILKKLDIAMLTVHISGGINMLNVVVKEFSETNIKTIGVTILTSLSNQDLLTINMKYNTSTQAVLFAKIAQSCKLSGVVCSGNEISKIRKECGENMTLIVPGIRADLDSIDDHKRTITASQAIKLGADYLVIGRPITDNDNPIAIIENILNTINAN